MNWEKKRQERDSLVSHIVQEILEAKLPCCYAEEIPVLLADKISAISESVAKKALFTEYEDAD